MRSWVLLDNQSMADTFCEKEYLQNIHTISIPLQLHTNGGMLDVFEKGYLPHYGEVGYHKDTIMNNIGLTNAIENGYSIGWEQEPIPWFTMTKGTNKISL